MTAQFGTPTRDRLRIRLSATLSLYLGRQVLLGIAVALFVLATVALVIDVVELLRRSRGREIGLDTVLLLATLHLPFLMQNLVPFAVLFGTMFTFQRLTRSRELVVARAVGVSVWQFLTPAIAVAASLGVFMVTAFNPLASATVERYQKLERSLFSSSGSLVSMSDGGFWLRQPGEDGENLVLHARQMTRDPLLLERVTVFVYAGEVDFTGRLDAPRARLEPGYWRLEDVLVAKPDGSREMRESVEVPTDLTAERIQESFAAPETMSFWHLPAFIESIEDVGFSAREHRLYWHGLLALPLLLSAMLLIATSFSLRLVRRGGTGLLVAAGVATGFLFYILSDVVFAIGLSGRVPIVLAAWTPAGVAVLLGLTTLLHLEDG